MPKNKKRKKENKFRKRLRKIASTPAFNVFLLFLLIFSVTLSSRFFFKKKMPAQMSFVENVGTSSNGKIRYQLRKQTEIFSGEVYSTAIRLREAAGLGLAISMTIFAETNEKKKLPQNPQAILSKVSSRGLIPPGVEFSNGSLSSVGSRFYFHYQTKPLRFEIVAFPDKTQESPAILLRFPLFSLDGKSITYFQTTSVSGFTKPTPFASMKSLIASGWTLEQWTGEVLRLNKEKSLKLLEEEKKIWNRLDR